MRTVTSTRLFDSHAERDYHIVACCTCVYYVRRFKVRQRHRSGTVVTPYHIHEASTHLGLDEEDVRDCVHELGGTVWEEPTESYDQQQVNHRGTIASGMLSLGHSKASYYYFSSFFAARQRLCL